MAVIVREKKKVQASGGCLSTTWASAGVRRQATSDKRAANAVKREVKARLAKGDMGILKEQCPTIAKYGKQWLDSPLGEQAFRSSQCCFHS